MLTTKEFLQAVITCPTPGWFCLALSNGNGGWLEQWYKWPQDVDEICEKAVEQATHANCYFSSYLFKSPQSLKENVLPTRTIQADLDDADMAAVPLQPTILVETSPGRHQGYWLLDPDSLALVGGTLPTEEHEDLSRKLTYSIELCDRSGWPIGRKVRIPGTINHKYLSGPKPVTVVGVSARNYKPEELEVLPEVPKFLVEHFDDGFIEDPIKGASQTAPALELLERIKNDVPATVWTRYDVRQQDRSEALWSLMVCAFKAGLTRDEVFTLSKGSANNKFEDLRARGDQALAKDVLRAEHAANTNAHDARAVIRDIYRKPLAPIERKRSIFSVVLQTMRDQGEFLNTRSGFPWYIRRDIGRPVMVTPHSKSLQTILDVQFGLNATEPEARYVAYGLSAYVDSLPDNAFQSSLSYYDPQAGHLLVHAGKGTVLQVTQYAVTPVTDGAHGVIFPWSSSVAVFSPAMRQGASALPPIDWGEEIFGNGERGFGSSVNNLINMKPEQAKALLKVWMLFVLLRNAANTRPILAMFGMPGSGKTLTAKKIYCVLYGPYKALSGVTNVDNFDMETVDDPLVVLDNVDTWEKWLPDRLAQAASVTEFKRRKLWTDADTVTLRRQAILGVTAHNPKFGREDIADRLLLFSYQRLDDFASEDIILGDILDKRNRIWGALIHDAQRVLRTPMPAHDEVPQFRIQDFARLGLWIARAIGEEDHFRKAITDVKSAQQAFTLEEEGMLVTAVARMIRTTNYKPNQQTAAQLWTNLEMCVDDPRTFAQTYRNSVQLSKKLSAMIPALRSIVDITQGVNEVGARTWKIVEKAG